MVDKVNIGNLLDKFIERSNDKVKTAVAYRVNSVK